jgi:hypothetical protein
MKESYKNKNSRNHYISTYTSRSRQNKHLIPKPYLTLKLRDRDYPQRHNMEKERCIGDILCRKNV